MASADLAALARFALAGAANTVLTGTLLLLLASWLAIGLAYTIVYVVGLAFTTAVSGRFVFRSRLTLRACTRFVAWYLGIYVLGRLVVRLAAASLGGSHILTVVALIAVTAPLNFLAARRIFRVREARAVDNVAVARTSAGSDPEEAPA